MLSESELWACANEQIRQQAFDAPIFAAMRADELFEQGDEAGAVAWRSIVTRINELLKPCSRPPNEAIVQNTQATIIIGKC